MTESYQNVKDHLGIILRDYESNQEWLQEVPHTRWGDFAVLYRMDMMSDDEILRISYVTKRWMSFWDVSLEQLHKDALAAERKRVPVLYYVEDIIFASVLGEPENLFETEGKRKIPEYGFFVFTNTHAAFGASLIMRTELLHRIGEIVGKNYYVLPASVHETLIFPETSKIKVKELTEMVRAVNSMEVSEEDLLSDKVQYYDCEARVLLNAEQHEQAMQEKREAEQKEVERREKSKPTKTPARSGRR